MRQGLGWRLRQQSHDDRCETIPKVTGADIAGDVGAPQRTTQTPIEAPQRELANTPGYPMNAISAAKNAYHAAYVVTASFEKADAIERRGRTAERGSAWFRTNGLCPC